MRIGKNLLNGKYRSKFNSNAFAASSIAWMVRYNMNVIFCKEETSGRLINFDLKNVWKFDEARGLNVSL